MSATTPVTPRSQTPDVAQLWPRGVAFWNQRDGVMVGYWSKPHCGRPCRPVIETTADGGRHWTVRARTKGPLTAVTPVPGGDLVATVSRRGLLVSGDRGRTWRRLTHERVYDASFSTPTQGWALGPSAGVAVTDDGGRTWRELPDPCRWAPTAQSVSAVSPTVAYVACVGEPGAGNQAKMIVRTDNGGASWTSVDAAPMIGEPAHARSHGLLTAGYLSGMAILPDLRGWLWADRGDLYRTDDAKYWTVIATKLVQPDVTTIVSADFLSDTTGFMLLSESDGTHLMRTTDGGARWSFIHTWPG
jgi:hypothetical protein